MGLTRVEIAEQDARMLKQHADFRKAAEYLAGKFGQLAFVAKVMLFGSVAKPLWKEVPRFSEYRRARVEVWHECKDVDLAVWLTDLTRLRELQIARQKGLFELMPRGVSFAPHQVEVFILEPGTNRYLGRLCNFVTCPKARKMDCVVRGCGREKHLAQHVDFEFYSNALEGAVLLFERGG